MLVNTTEIVKATVGAVNKQTTFASLSPFVLQAEQQIAVSVLGQSLYDLLDANITGNTLTSVQIDLLKYVQPMISAFAIYYGSGLINIQIGDTGFQTPNVQHANPTPVWQYNEARQNLFRIGDNYRELSYKFLQTNAVDFPEWTSSSAYTIYNELLIRSNAELHTYLGKGENVGTYLALRPFISLSQSKYLTPTLCADYLDYLLAGDSLTSYDMQAMKKAQACLAWFAFAEALPSLKCILIDGVLVTSMPGESSKVVAALTREEKNDLQTDAFQKANNYMGQLNSYLKENVDNLPEYQSTSCYQSTLTALNDDLPKGFHKGKNSAGFHF